MIFLSKWHNKNSFQSYVLNCGNKLPIDTVTLNWLNNLDMRNIAFATATLFFSSMASTAVTAETFTYSGGCFWCTEADTEKLDGVSEVISGFTGGTTASPRYEPGKWGDHREAAQVIYDPEIISYEKLVRHVYATIDLSLIHISEPTRPY